MTLVVDASVAMKWYLLEDGADSARQILAGGKTLVAPELVVAEVCSGSWIAYRRREITATQQGRIAADIACVFDRLESLVHHSSRAAAIARELDHAAYDCFYLAVSEALDAPLVTVDGRLLAKVAGTRFAARTLGLNDYTPRN